MCRNIQTLFNFEPPATEEEVRNAALQYVRKISGFTKPSQANEAAFNRAVDEMTHASLHLLADQRAARSASRPPDAGVSLDAFAGQVIRPGDSEYDAARVVWNGMVERRPALIVRPTGPDDVVTALRHAREQDFVVAVRCGGHSIPGHSTCDDGIVIDLSHMRGAAVDPDRRTALCAGGALLAELDEAAQAVGLV